MIVQKNLYPHTPRTSNRAQDFKPVGAGEKSAHVIFVLDDSGSMQSCRHQTIEGFNEFLAGQKESEVPTYVSLYKFDGWRTVQMYEHVPVSVVEKLNTETYNPQGGTNLLDAMGDVMIKVNSELAAYGKKSSRDSVTIVILTDGEENQSKEFSTGDIKAMVEKSTAANWGFFFLGANIDAFATSSNLGFNVNNTLQYSTERMGQTMSNASRAVNSTKSARASGAEMTENTYAAVGFTTEERKDVI